MKPIKTVIIDDSALVRQVGKEILGRAPDIEVIGTYPDPLAALERMPSNWPDVIVLDIEMPRMDGLTFLRNIMAERPTPTVICSSLAQAGAATTMEALAAGALAVITKPKLGVKQFLEDSSNNLVTAVRAAARANMRHLREDLALAREAKLPPDALLPAKGSPAAALSETTEKVVAIGTSTGGTQALEVVLTRLPRVVPGLVVVQHMPEKFTAMFAERLSQLCTIEVKEAQDGDRVLPGRALIAPGGRHMLLKRSGAQYYVEVRDGPLVNRHKPSVDVLFRSVAQAAGRNALGIIMTGMGDDGARGLREMHEMGAQTIAEDESTCVVFGMPRVAIQMGGVDKVVPLPRIADEIIAYGK